MIALFDVDGVLNTGVFADYSEIGINSSVMEPFWKGEFNDCLTGRKDTKEVLLGYLDKWNYRGSIDDFFRHWHESENFLFSDVLEEVKRLSKVMAVYTATNQDKYRLDYLRNEMGLGGIFNKMYSSCNVGYVKPDKKYYEIILDDLNIPPSEVMYWDDSIANIETAKTLGINAFHVTNRKKLTAEIRELQQI